MPIFGAVDVGSNTFRFWVAEFRDRGVGSLPQVKSLGSGRETVRLGEGLSQQGILSPAAIDRAIQALKRFRLQMDVFPMDRLVVSATSAVRVAQNRGELVARIRKDVGWDLEVISGEEEARRTALGVALGLNGGLQDALLADIGGGSTELIRILRGESESCVSLDVGVIPLAERYLHADPTTPSEIEAIRGEIDGMLRSGVSKMNIRPETELIGTAGTLTSLAALDLGLVRYEPEQVNGHLLYNTEIRKWLERLSSMTLAQRRRIKVMERGREDLIVAGTAVVMALLEVAGKDRFRVSEFGLREGILYDLFIQGSRGSAQERRAD